MAEWNDPRITTDRSGVVNAATVGVPRATRDAGLRSYMLSVYNYMASGVLLTGIVALLFAPYAQQVLKNFIDSQARKVTIESIQKMVAEQFGLRLVEIKAKNNSRAIVYPRQIAMYLAKHLTEASLPEIGRQFGGKHHTTVLHSVEKIEEVRKNDKDLNRLINRLTEQLGG